MIKYIVVSQDSAEELENKVQDLLGDGWKLVGGVSVCVMFREDRFDHLNYSQALTYERSSDS